MSCRFAISVDGIGGIGKTELVVQVTHECLEASEGTISNTAIPKFDAFIWVSAKERDIALNDLLDTVARTLDYAGIAQRSPEQKADEVRKLLRTIRCLVIVDNFETIKDEEVRSFLSELPEPSKALLTSREQKLRQARAVSIHGMDKDEAITLIRAEGNRLSLSSVEHADEGVLRKLYQATGGAPLAIKWAVGQIKQRGQSLDTVLDSLYEAKGDIFENIFDRSWGLLSENAKHILMVMPIFASSAAKVAIEAASEIRRSNLDEGLGQLAEMWLVEEVTGRLEEEKRRYSVHPLTRAFARVRLKEKEGLDKQSYLRAADFFLDYARKFLGRGYWQPYYTLGYAALQVERVNILGIMDWCYELEEWQLIVDLAVAMVHFLGRYGYWYERTLYAKRAIEAARHVRNEQNEEAEMWMLVDAMTWMYIEQGKLDEAEKLIMEGLTIAEKRSSRCGIALAECYLAIIEGSRKNEELALQHIQRGLSANCDDLDTVTRLYEAWGRWAFRRADYNKALGFFSEALATSDKRGEEQNARWMPMIGMADTLVTLGQYAEARQYYQGVLDIEVFAGFPVVIANAKLGLAFVEEHEGQYTKALQLTQAAAIAFEQLGMKEKMEKAKELIGSIERRLAQDRSRFRD